MPYSYSARKILKVRFQQPSDLDRSVNICDFGGWGAGEGGNLECTPEAKGISPFPCVSKVEAWRGRRRRFVMEAAEGHVTTNVEMVADEVCCWPAEHMATGSGVPRLRVLSPNMRCLKSESRAAGCALLQNEHSDEVKGNTPSRLAIRASRKQSQ